MDFVAISVRVDIDSNFISSTAVLVITYCDFISYWIDSISTQKTGTGKMLKLFLNWNYDRVDNWCFFNILAILD